MKTIEQSDKLITTDKNIKDLEQQVSDLQHSAHCVQESFTKSMAMSKQLNHQSEQFTQEMMRPLSEIGELTEKLRLGYQQATITMTLRL
ncbi:hypothetical protein LP123_14385 (plasmid) [Moraxella bovis]|uniref:hypothetical protein n=1 Tax=Moraxella bovis TaxID=476 RepID=UPI00222772F2|nr:hypothetical protein [Moraxella bovis]UZA07609.1 hypothetical protein LP099_14405 [Moraxella bovis]UZA13004.1 hypothetical protein LP123_14385 [Moraxella bovis]